MGIFRLPWHTSTNMDVIYEESAPPSYNYEDSAPCYEEAQPCYEGGAGGIDLNKGHASGGISLDKGPSYGSGGIDLGKSGGDGINLGKTDDRGDEPPPPEYGSVGNFQNAAPPPTYENVTIGRGEDPVCPHCSKQFSRPEEKRSTAVVVGVWCVIIVACILWFFVGLCIFLFTLIPVCLCFCVPCIFLPAALLGTESVCPHCGGGVRIVTSAY